MDEHHPTPRRYKPNGRAAYKKKLRRKRFIRKIVIIIVTLILLVLVFTQCISPVLFNGGSNESDNISSSEDSSSVSAQQSNDVQSIESAENVSSQEVLSQETGIVGLKTVDWTLILVNQSYPLDASYTPEIAYIPEKYIINSSANRFDSRAITALTSMIQAAEKEGITLRVTSAYRDMAYQQGLFESKVKEIMNSQSVDRATAESEAAKYVAIPGTSEHCTGLAVDIVSANYFTQNKELNENFEQTEEFKWLDENAASYGFILRFPKGKEEITKISYEPWHYRYVGVENAESMKSQGVTLEEYLGKVS